MLVKLNRLILKAAMEEPFFIFTESFSLSARLSQSVRLFLVSFPWSAALVGSARFLHAVVGAPGMCSQLID